MNQLAEVEKAENISPESVATFKAPAGSTGIVLYKNNTKTEVGCTALLSVWLNCSDKYCPTDLLWVQGVLGNPRLVGQHIVAHDVDNEDVETVDSECDRSDFSQQRQPRPLQQRCVACTAYPKYLDHCRTLESVILHVPPAFHWPCESVPRRPWETLPCGRGRRWTHWRA